MTRQIKAWDEERATHASRLSANRSSPSSSSSTTSASISGTASSSLSLKLASESVVNRGGEEGGKDDPESRRSRGCAGVLLKPSGDSDLWRFAPLGVACGGLSQYSRHRRGNIIPHHCVRSDEKSAVASRSISQGGKRALKLRSHFVA